LLLGLDRLLSCVRCTHVSHAPGLVVVVLRVVSWGMHVSVVPNRNSRPSILLRETWREDGRVRKRTLANLTDSISLEQAEVLRKLLKGETLVAPEDAFEIIASLPHGHVQAVLLAMQRLEIEKLLASRPSKERSLIAALVAYRVLDPRSKLATTRAWSATTLPEELGVAGANENDIYAGMDWLVARKDRIEAKLAARHLGEGSLVLFDLSSSYVEGERCQLAEFGYNRDGKRGKKQINWGLLTNGEGMPVSLSMFPGSTGDPSTLMPQVETLRERFGLERFTLIGDRGMITGKHIEYFQSQDGIDWITALKSQSLRKLTENEIIQPSLFDETNLVEVTSDDFPGERLIACRNPILGRKRAHKRQELLEATTSDLQKIQQRVRSGRLSGQDKIGLKVGEKLGRHNMSKHFKLTISDDDLAFEIDQDSVEREAKMDGIYVIRTSVDTARMSAEEAVRAYKSLAMVERAFRVLKSIDLQARPIHHRLPDRVKAHLFICLLAYYVRMHMEAAWASLTYKDEHEQDDEHDDETMTAFDPVLPAQKSQKAKRKAQTGTLEDGQSAHTFKTLLASLQTITRNTCVQPESGITFPRLTRPNPDQQKALDLINTITL
jgi:transposase